MILSKNKWNLKYENQYSDREIIDILHRIKGIEDYVSYHSLGFKDFHDPYDFSNMEKTVKKIKMSIRNNERILIYGDYDVDGITATALLYRTLKSKGADVHYKVPNRFSDGYGLCKEVCDDIIQEGNKLVITVDNGITCIDEIKQLVDAGISVILTDHHEPKDELPPTEYIIHSYLLHDYPFEHLCGAGVSFRLCEALDKDFAWQYVDFAMLGTIADMMPIIGENKAIVNEGIKRINDSKSLGLRVLLETIVYNDLNKRSIEYIKDVSFNIAPKLNSLGRVADASIAVELLISDSRTEIDSCLKNLLEADKLRKELTIQNTELAYKLISKDDSVCLIYSSSFYEGVLGIIAQKVMKKTGKITGVFNVNKENYARGSFRTYGDYNILELLEKNKDLLDKFGGHEKACGVSMEASRIKELKARLELEVKQTLPMEPSLDAAISLNHSLVNLSFIKELKQYDMIDTTFLFRKLEVVQTQLFSSKHTKVKCRLQNGAYVSVLCFNDASLSYNLSPRDFIDVMGEINSNSYNGYDYVQITAKDYRVETIQVIDYRSRNDFSEAMKYFDTDNGLIVNYNDFDNMIDFDTTIQEESPNIIYLAPFGSTQDDELRITDPQLLRRAIYIISTSPMTNEIMLQKSLNVSKNVLNTILTIFEELSLISRNNGKITNVPREGNQKVDLNTSETYRSYNEAKGIKSLLRDDINKIKEHVLSALEFE